MLDLTESLLLSILVGLIAGSFISMLTWRLPRMMELAAEQQLKNISFSRSQCVECQQPLSWKQLIPVFSWIFYKGRCGHCDHKISWRYPLIELSTALLTILCVWQFGLTLEGLFAVGFSWFLMTILVIDIEHQLILDKLSLPLLWIGLLINTQSFYVSPQQAILGAVLGYMILWSIFQAFKLVTGKEGMGFGDFKLLAALGAWFGAFAIPQIILVASISSLLFALVLTMLKIRQLNEPIPFGPYLALGGFSVLFLEI